MEKYIKAFNKFFTSVKLAIILLISLTMLSIVGMLIPQKGLLNSYELQIWQTKYPELSTFISKIGLDSIFTSKFFILISFIFLINTLTCTIKQIKLAYNLWVKRKNVNKIDVTRIGNSFTINNIHKELLTKIEALIEAKGFNVEIVQGYYYYGYKRRFGHWGSSIFHIGLVILVLGVFISFTYKIEGRVNITEGQTFTGTVNEYINFSKGPLAAVPNGEFNVLNEKVNVKGTKDNVIEAYSSNILATVNSNQTIKKQEVKTNNNLEFQGYTFYPYEYGFSPAIIVEEKGTPIFSAYSELVTKRVKDNVEYTGDIKLPNQGLILKITFIPNILKQSYTKQSIPAVLYEFKDLSGASLYNGSLSLGQNNKVGNFKISFPDYRRWAGFIVVKDYGINIIYFGGFLALLGLYVLYFWVPQEIYVDYRNHHNKNDKNTITIGGRSKKYAISFNEEIQELKSQIERLCGGENE